MIIIMNDTEIKNAFFNYDNPEGHELQKGEWEKRRDDWLKFKAYYENAEQMQNKNKDEEISSEYPFEEGDTYYILDGDEWVECIWDIVSEVIHGAFPNKEYYREPNKESKV
jgi:hypothetical protein